jgi:tRNA/tmRNA/rRNA uracil-C5-methylase (TrmA/RlmC/RlmD family)
MTFADILRATAGRRRQPMPPAHHPEPLAALDYAEELALKQQALGAFWQDENLPGRPERIVPAPLPRGYRTTSKRRAAFGAKGLTLSFPGASDRGRSIIPTAGGLAASVLDCPEHAAVYAFLIERIGRPVAQPLAVALNWVIVRGSAGGLAVILNVRVFDARVVRAAKLLAEALQAETSLGVRSGFLYLDPTRSEYYLEADRPADSLSFKRLFGPDFLQIDSAGVRLRFPPTAFSQVNGAMLTVMVENVRSLLAPLDGGPLLDLYCGYGLFSLTVGREAAQVVGADLDGPAIEAARANAAHLDCAKRMRFLSGRIDGPFLAERLRAPRTPEAILLDPPRQGTEPGVAAALAARAPLRVVHLCCGTDEIPREIAAWSRAGYELQRVVSLDLFAGTTGLETLLLLTPKPQPVPAARPIRTDTRPPAPTSAPPPARPSGRPSSPTPARSPARPPAPASARPRRGRVK